MKKGFTLLELILVIVILGVLATLISGNFITSLKKGRDARRKADLEQIQRALEMYYEDKKAYPSSITFGGPLVDSTSGKIYMQKIPNDPLSNINYRYCVDLPSSPSKYQLYAKLENSQDPKIITPAPLPSCTANCPDCNYGISSPNTNP
ncbi:MAG: type II secretion system protein [Microgenomates group bacterium]